MVNNLSKLESEILKYFIKEDFKKVRILSDELFSQAKSLNNKFYMASSYGIMGYMQYELSNYTKAIDYLLKAVSITQEAERSFIDTGHLALCYSKINDLESANLYVDKAVDAAIKLDHHAAKYDWFNFKGNLLLKQKHYDLAIAWADKSISEIPNLIDENRPEIIFYQPYLTKYEIKCELGLKHECNDLNNRLSEFFNLIENPVLHVRRDKNKYFELSKDL